MSNIYSSSTNQQQLTTKVVYGKDGDGNIDISHGGDDGGAGAPKISVNGIVVAGGGGNLPTDLTLNNLTANVSINAPNGGLNVAGTTNSIFQLESNHINLSAGGGLDGSVNAVNYIGTGEVQIPNVETQAITVNTQNGGAGTIDATNAITGGSVVSQGTISSVGNLSSGGNISCTGTSNFTGLLTAVNGVSSGGDVSTTQNFEATGNAPYGLINGRIATATERVQTSTVLFKASGASGPELQSPPQAGQGINENNLYVVIPVNPPTGNEGEIHFANDNQESKIIIKPSITEFVNPIKLNYLDGPNGFQPERYTTTKTNWQIRNATVGGQSIFSLPSNFTRMSDNTSVPIPDGLYICEIDQTASGGTASITGFHGATFYRVDGGSLTGTSNIMLTPYFSTSVITKGSPPVNYNIGSGKNSDTVEIIKFGTGTAMDIYCIFPNCNEITGASNTLEITMTYVMP